MSCKTFNLSRRARSPGAEAPKLKRVVRLDDEPLVAATEGYGRTSHSGIGFGQIETVRAVDLLLTSTARRGALNTDLLVAGAVAVSLDDHRLASVCTRDFWQCQGRLAAGEARQVNDRILPKLAKRIAGW